jgi:hypothetical protein
MGALCEMAYSQGVDLYAADDYRFRKACEYVARYNLGNDDVPFTTYVNCDGETHTAISASGRGQVRPVWERVFHHHRGRLEQDCPNHTGDGPGQLPGGRRRQLRLHQRRLRRAGLRHARVRRAPGGRVTDE